MIINNRKNGFTLIEIMIAVAIIGILTTVSLPIFKNYRERAVISEGLSFMKRAEQIINQYYQDNRTFGAAGSSNNVCSTNKMLTITRDLPDYRGGINCNVTNSGNSISITARSSSGWTFSLDEQGNKSMTSTAQGYGSPPNCWIKNTDLSCS